MTALNIHIEHKTYGNGTCALRDLTLKTHSGQFTAILGPSGSGKTTLLNIIAGLDQDISGQVDYDHQQPANIGFMFQESRLMPWLTVQQNIELVIKGQKESQQQAAIERIPTMLQQVGLQQFAKSYPGQLSIGMQRRVSLVRAFIIRPDLLLMDEPFQSLDAPTADQLRDLLLDLWRETQASIVFVTHDLSEALSLADRIIFLSSRPAQVMLDYPVNLKRPRQQHDVSLTELKQQLMHQHPNLLSGLID